MCCLSEYGPRDHSLRLPVAASGHGSSCYVASNIEILYGASQASRLHFDPNGADKAPMYVPDIHLGI